MDCIKSGCKGLDQLFGGSIPANNVIVFEQDVMNVYNDLLIKSIASYCLYEKYLLTYAAPRKSLIPLPDFIKRLPSRPKTDTKSCTSSGNESMKIAFRYNHMPSLHSSLNESNIDFGRQINEHEISENNFCMDKIRLVPLEDVLNDPLVSLTPAKSASSCPHVIIIANIKPELTCQRNNLAKVFYGLKCLSRTLTKTVIILTYQPNYYTPLIRNRIRHISDTTIQIDAFDPEKGLIYDENFKAILYVHKISRLLSSSSGSNNLVEMGIKMEKNDRFFCIQELFIPPDIGDNPSRQKASIVNDDLF